MGGFFISVDELKELLDANAVPAVIDVRKPAAFEADTTMLPTAQWRDHTKVGSWMAELDPDKPIVVYCVHGHEVSQGAATELRNRDYQARVLSGGIEGWREAGAPLVEKSGPLTGGTE